MTTIISSQMATLIDHITRMDAQIEGRGFFILNKGMATTVSAQTLLYACSFTLIIISIGDTFVQGQGGMSELPCGHSDVCL